MLTPINVRKKPITVQAIEWTGDNLAAVQAFTGIDKFAVLPAGDSRRPTFTALVFDHLHEEWIPLRDHDLVMRGIDGEHYPCEASVFARSYEQVDAA